MPRKTKRKHTRRLNRMTNHKHRTHKRIAHRCGGGVLTMCTPEEKTQLNQAVAEATPIRAGGTQISNDTDQWVYLGHIKSKTGIKQKKEVYRQFVLIMFRLRIYPGRTKSSV